MPWNLIDAKPAYENAPEPMLVTLSGIVIEVKLVHHENTLSPMLVTLSGIVIEVKPVHS